MEPYYVDRQPMRPHRSRSRSRERAPRGSATSRHERPPQRDSQAPRMQHNEKETDPRRPSQRRKEIAYGKNTLGYERYLRMVPKEKRRHPRDHAITEVVRQRLPREHGRQLGALALYPIFD